ncbi:uncharacterized protein LOC117646712 isoform X2 [Thrips palmi]|uniref:Uncharacterized protein LOC117646712 isoform X2 n=1 Tax=Thrips palmi TaxID=161013 RepID=A0A6P8ZP99_THRPL|nr:uncharacterized protein LOC117646712 isoform X2 [Thrips palmi]
MLNCTDLECILHHHHYYHHLHQLQHHAAVADPASESDDVLHLLNSTDGELSGLSHLDAPISDSVYIVCGVLIAMVLVGLIIVLLAVTISKLRKREETNNNSLAPGHAPTRTHQLQPLQHDGAKAPFAQSQAVNGVAVEVPTVVTTAITTTAVAASVPVAAPVAPVCPDSADSASSGLDSADGEDEDDGKVAPLELFLWSYPNQLSPFSGTKDALVREIPCEVPQDSKGLRKNLRGKWKRLVKKKPEDTCSIPPELRDQLKQIYVY